MTRTLYAYLMQPGVLLTGLIGTVMQLALGVANNLNVAGIADTIAHYGLSGQLTSGGLVAAVTGLFYSLTERISGHTVATGAGAAAGGISGTLGTALSQAIGITPLAAGATQVINFALLPAALLTLFGLADPAVTTAAHAAAPAASAIDTTALTQIFATTATGGAGGALLGRFVTGHQTRRAARKPSHAHHAH